MTEKVGVANLHGVPETMLWPLYARATEARRPDARLRDPHAVRIADAIDYDYARSFGKPHYAHVNRALAIDDLLRRWIRDHPAGQVVGLGEGLETQFYRVDNGQVRWLSVDVAEAIGVRTRFLPDTDRYRNFACSAVDFRWMGEVDATHGLIVTAAGLLMYLRPDEVTGLIAAIAARFPTAEVVFDTVPRWASVKTLRGLKLTDHYVVPPMPWSLRARRAGYIKRRTSQYRHCATASPTRRTRILLRPRGPDPSSAAVAARTRCH